MSGTESSASVFTARVREQMHDILEREFRRTNLRGRAPELEKVIRQYIDRPAKLLRPRLLLETATAYGAEVSPPLLEIAAATELLHTFALLHDDCIDGAHGREVPSSSGDEAFEMRLLAGDFLHALAYAVIAELVVTRALPAAVLEIVRSVSLDTVAGQAMDLELSRRPISARSAAELYELYDLKTGRYSFDAPMQIGALYAGSPQRDQAALSELARYLGRAYQLYDDMVDTEQLLSAPRERHEPVASWELNLVAAMLAEKEADGMREIGELSRVLERIEPEEVREFAEPMLAELLSYAERQTRRLSLERASARRLLGAATQHLCVNGRQARAIRSCNSDRDDLHV